MLSCSSVSVQAHGGGGERIIQVLQADGLLCCHCHKEVTWTEVMISVILHNLFSRLLETLMTCAGTFPFKSLSSSVLQKMPFWREAPGNNFLITPRQSILNTRHDQANIIKLKRVGAAAACKHHNNPLPFKLLLNFCQNKKNPHNYMFPWLLNDLSYRYKFILYFHFFYCLFQLFAWQLTVTRWMK